MTDEQLGAKLHSIPVGGGIVVVQPEVNTTADTVIFVKRDTYRWVEYAYPFASPRATVRTAAVIFACARVPDILILDPEWFKRDDALSFLRGSVDNALRTHLVPGITA